MSKTLKSALSTANTVYMFADYFCLKYIAMTERLEINKYHSIKEVVCEHLRIHQMINWLDVLLRNITFLVFNSTIWLPCLIKKRQLSITGTSMFIYRHWKVPVVMCDDLEFGHDETVSFVLKHKQHILPFQLQCLCWWFVMNSRCC